MDVMHYFTGLVRFHIPPEREADARQLIRRHIRQFFEAYQRRDSL